MAKGEGFWSNYFHNAQQSILKASRPILTNPTLASFLLDLSNPENNFSISAWNHAFYSDFTIRKLSVSMIARVVEVQEAKEVFPEEGEERVSASFGFLAELELKFNK